MVDALYHSAAVAVLATLITESSLFSTFRTKLNWDLFYCPICISFWLAIPTLWYGGLHYFLTLALANVWMLVILNNYKLLGE